MSERYFVDIHVPDGSVARHELSKEPTMVGTGPRASIRVSSASGFAAEQLELLPDPEGVQVKLPVDTRGSVIYEGLEQRRVHVPYGADIFVGKTRLEFVSESFGGRRSQLMLLLVPLVLIGLGFSIYRAASPDDPTSREVLAPPLFDQNRKYTCPQSESALAERRSIDDERAAQAKQQRFAFDSADGVQAALLFGEAIACLRVAGKAQEASRVNATLTRWSSRLNGYYTTVQLRLRILI